MKMKKLIALSTLAVGFGALVSLAPAKRVQVRAEGEEETTAVEEIKEKQNKFMDEFLTPLIIALGSADVLTVVGVVGSTVIRGKREKAKMAALVSLSNSLVETITKLHDVEQKTQEMLKIFQESYGNTLNLIEDEKKVLLSYQEDLAKVQDLKNTMVCMAEAQLASLKGQVESVKSGLSHEIAEIEEKLKLLK